MPKIITYEQQLGIPSGAIRSDASPETAGLQGRAIGRVGGVIAEVGQQIDKANIQKDINSTYSSIAEIRNKYTTRITEETQQGTIDVEKLNTDFQDDLNKITGGVKTPEGKDYLSKHGTDLQYDLVRSAAIAQAQVAGKMAVEKWTNAINLNGNTLQQDPAAFETTFTDSLDTIEAQVQAGALDRTDAEKLKRLTGEELAMNTIKGWANISPETAQTLMDEGKFDKFLDPDKKTAAYQTIKSYKAAEEAEVERRKKVQKEQEVKIQEEWENTNLEKLNNNTLTGKEILAAPIKAQRKITWMNMLKASAKGDAMQTDPAVKNMLVKRLVLPDDDPNKIIDSAQLYQYVGKGIAIKDLTEMQKFMDKTPEGMRLKDNRRRLMQQAESTLMKKDPITGQPDPQGPFSMSLFTNEMMNAEERMRKAGKDITDLYDPNSKDYFGKQIFKYKATPQEIFNRQMNMKEFDIPEGVDEKRRKGESAAEYLKRMAK